MNCAPTRCAKSMDDAAASADDTAAADTALSDPAPETVIVPDVGQPAAELAWSSDSDTAGYGASTERYTWRATWVRAAAFAVGSAVVAGAIGGVWAWQRPAHTHPAPVWTAPAAPAAPISQAPNVYQGTAAAAGAGMRSAIPDISQVITITDANDGNHMIGRAGGYTGAVVFIDTRTRHDASAEQCDTNDPGVDACGAAIEEWPSASDAEQRKAYITNVTKSLPMLGNEWMTTRGNLLLRVGAQLTQTAATQYSEAFLKLP
jgi:serine/threonine protein kinase, bacterial